MYSCPIDTLFYLNNIYIYLYLYWRIRLINSKPESTNMWSRRFGEDRSTEAEVHELKNYLLVINKPQADKVQRYKLHSHFVLQLTLLIPLLYMYLCMYMN